MMIMMIMLMMMSQVPGRWRQWCPDFHVHVGVSHLVTSLTLETTAHNQGYSRPDARRVSIMLTRAVNKPS